MAVSLGKAADDIYKLKQEVKKHKDAIAKLQAQITRKEDALLKRLHGSEVDHIKGSIANASISEVSVPTVQDWDKVYKYISRYKAFDLLQRRMSSTAYNDRIEAGKRVPGVSTYHLVKLNVSKRRA